MKKNSRFFLSILVRIRIYLKNTLKEVEMGAYEMGFEIRNVNEFDLQSIVSIKESSFTPPELISYMTALMGTLGDQLTTRIGLSMSGLCEANPLPAFLMKCRLWLPFDVLIVALAIGLPALFIRRYSTESRWACLSLPLIFGSTRLLATVWNLRLIL